MATGVPAVQQLEMEFTSGVWTDVTADWDAPGGAVSIRYGRTSQFSQPGPASMTFQLDNHLGKYTPLRQVLADGVTVHPYWPNVRPRVRVRYSYTISAVKYVRFLGYVKAWPPGLENGVRPVVTITATDRSDQLSRVKLKSPIAQEISQDSPVLWWPLTDPAGSLAAGQAPTVGPYPLAVQGTGPALVFGDVGPGVGDGTGVKFAPASASSGQYLSSRRVVPFGSAGIDAVVECWVNAGTSLSGWAAGGVENILEYEGIIIGLSSGVPFATVTGTAMNGVASIADGGWHNIAVGTSTGLGVPADFYVDGVNVDGASVVFNNGARRVVVGDALTLDARFTGNIGQVAIFGVKIIAGSHSAATNGYDGDTTAVRVGRYLEAGHVFDLGDLVADVGQTTVGTYPQDGKDIVTACQDMATTEGGVVWWPPTAPFGEALFRNRRFRDTTTPVLTLDATADLDAPVYDPDYSEAALVNMSTVARSAESGTLSTQTYTDTPSVTTYGATTGDVTTYTQSDQDALNLAQAQVAGNAQPRFRFDRVAVNLAAAVNNLYVALASVEIGARIRITNLQPGASPTPTVDLFVEGWSESVTEGVYRVVFDTSPADNPPRWKWGTSRWQCDGQTLNAAVTNSATTVVIATAAGKPTFTLGYVGAVEMVTNPGFETNTAGWTVTAGTLTRDTATFHSGVASGRYDTTGTAPEYVYTDPALTASAAMTYQGSVWVKGTGTAQLFILSYPAGAAFAQTGVVTMTGSWQQITCTGTTPVGATSVRLFLAQQTTGVKSISIDDASLLASTAYPMNIKVGAEVITLNTGPGGATSPQTFTGVTRGTNGTAAAAQAAAAAVALWPADTWAL